MAKKSPQTNCFKIAYWFKKANDIAFIVIIMLSIIFSLLEMNKIVECLSIFLIIILSVFEFIIEDYQEKAEQKRRNDFLDNSFGSKLSDENSIEYYSNDNLQFGLYKMMVNVFENTLFSLEISGKMKIRAWAKNLPIILIVVGFAIYGLLESKIAIPILQLFISQYFLKDLIVVNKYNAKLESMYNEIVSLFNGFEGNIQNNLKKNEAKVLKIYLQYETNITHTKLFLDTKIYNKYNDEISEKWDVLKKRYGIE
jgi:hypothetical protein